MCCSVTRPPGGVSTIFSDSDTASTSSSASSTTGEVSPTTKRPQKVCCWNFFFHLKISSFSSFNSDRCTRWPQTLSWVMSSHLSKSWRWRPEEGPSPRVTRPLTRCLIVVTYFFLHVVNPLTGELIGNFGYGVEAKDDEGDQSVPAAAQVTPVKSSRVPPGGYSTPLW